MARARQEGPAHQTRALGLIAAMLACACSQRGDPAGFVRRPDPLTQPRPTGCIDTPQIGGNPGAPDQGVACGRARSTDAGLVGGLVTAQYDNGLPGPGLEGLWVTIHAIDDAHVQLDALPAARAQTQTGPQGSFSFPAVGSGSFVIVVRASASGPILAAQRLDANSERKALHLAVPTSQ